MRSALALIVIGGCAHAPPIVCPVGERSIVVVDTRAHRMALCEGGTRVEEVSVAIGRGGTGKQRRGDRKTPLGSYALATPRPSSKFHTFIGIRYPTPEQAASGRTGAAIGIHGPSRRFGWLGAFRNRFDWTDGCIAVKNDATIDRVARWIGRAEVRRIEIR